MASHSKQFPIPGQNADSIYEAVVKSIDLFLSKTPLGKYELQNDAQAKKVSFKASMASGTLTAQDGSLKVDLSLSLMATPFKGKIDEGIEKWLNKAFPKA